MILAWRIPALTEQMRAATIRAANEQKAPASLTGTPRTEQTPERREGELERLAA